MKKFQIAPNLDKHFLTTAIPEPKEKINFITPDMAIDFARMIKNFQMEATTLLWRDNTEQTQEGNNSQAQIINNRFLDLTEGLDDFTIEIAHHAGMTQEYTVPEKPKTEGAIIFDQLETTLNFLDKLGYETAHLTTMEAIDLKFKFMAVIESTNLYKK